MIKKKRDPDYVYSQLVTFYFRLLRIVKEVVDSQEN